MCFFACRTFIVSPAMRPRSIPVRSTPMNSTRSDPTRPAQYKQNFDPTRPTHNDAKS